MSIVITKDEKIKHGINNYSVSCESFLIFSYFKIPLYMRKGPKDAIVIKLNVVAIDTW